MPALIAAVLLALSVLLLPGPASAATGDVGSEGPSHTGTGTPTGSKRAESVLWYNDGSWWGNLWDTGTSDFHIFRFNAATQSWDDTKVPTETRANTHHDVLWDGTTLYVASHMFVADETPAAFPSSTRKSTLRRPDANDPVRVASSHGSSLRPAKPSALKVKSRT